MVLLKFLVKKNDGSDTQKQEVKKPSLVTHKVSTREKYNGYTPEQRVHIAKYAAENRHHVL